MKKEIKETLEKLVEMFDQIDHNDQTDYARRLVNKALLMFMQGVETFEETPEDPVVQEAPEETTEELTEHQVDPTEEGATQILED